MLDLVQGSTPLHVAVRWPDVREVEFLLCNGSDVNARTLEVSLANQAEADLSGTTILEPCRLAMLLYNIRPKQILLALCAHMLQSRVWIHDSAIACYWPLG